MSFYVGAVLGGPEVRTSALVEAIQETSRNSDRLRDGAGEDVAIDLVFHVPGSMIKPPYQGLRTGKLSRKEKILMVQVAVAEDDVFTDEPFSVIFDAMRQAVELAAPVFSTSGIVFSSQEHLELIESLRDASKPR